MLDYEKILELLPQAEPFVFVDEAEIQQGSIKGSYTISGKESFLAGHFPGRPIFPASIMTEALGQLGIVYLRDQFRSPPISPESIYFIKSELVKCYRKCIPGDSLEMHLRVLRVREPLIQFAGRIKVAGELAVKIDSLTLSFSTQPGN